MSTERCKKYNRPTLALNTRLDRLKMTGDLVGHSENISHEIFLCRFAETAKCPFGDRGEGAQNNRRAGVDARGR